jgi:Type I restriction enzyme R protein N terminus (HSDR_N)
VQNLKLPSYSFRIAERKGRQLIFDENRRRWIVLTPEEWVRQNFIRFLRTDKKFPAALMAIEKKVMINGLSQRFDLLVYDRKGNPLLIAEFKSPDVQVNQMTFDQASRYNSVLRAPFFLISNGMIHFVSKLNFENRTTRYLAEIPGYDDLIQS